MKPVIEAIFVDFGNVCATFETRHFIENFSRKTGVSFAAIESALFEKTDNGVKYVGYSKLFAALECGEVGPVGFFRALTGALDCAERIDYATFANMWIDIFYGENKELDELLFRVPQKKYLLSNTNTIVHGRYIAQCTIVRNHFPSRAERILSYDIGVVKPNPLIYKVALKQASVRAAQALFVDDMEENIDAWKALGGHGIVYHAGKNSIQELEKQLRELGVLK